MELDELFPAATPHRSSTQAALPDDYEAWLRFLFPSYLTYPFADHHRELWEWVWAREKGVSPRPFVAVWPRGGAKSTSIELAVVAMGARRVCNYGLYICRTQEQADDHVETVGAMLESPAIERAYPLLAQRSVGKYGNSRGWRRNRLWTASGLVIDALGLDTAGRGVKLEENRPDFIILDDIDGELDTMEAVEKNIKRLSRKLLPAGSEDVAVIAVQNLVIPHGVFARLARHEGAPPSEILSNRIVSGPIPALRNLTYEQTEAGYRITGGEPSWEGQGVAVCQQQLERWGLTAFLEEAQHEVDVPDGGMFSHLEFAHAIEDEAGGVYRIGQDEDGGTVPVGSAIRMLDGCVWIDPAVTDTDHSDAHGISVASLGMNGVTYIRRSWESRTSPLDSLKRGITYAMELGIDRVGVETDQGGDTWESVYQQACYALGITIQNAPRFVSAKAGAGYQSKVHRASQMLADYERGKIVHVLGTHTALERSLRRFPKTKPFDLTDATFWAWNDLRSVWAQTKQRDVMLAGRGPAVVFEE